MPISPTTGGLITAGAGLLGSAINAASTARQNRLQREWNEKMYGIQRKDSLADWNMQNEYNSPTQQMLRLKAAGLNPNLVYGNGADTQAGAVRNTESKSWNPTPPQIDLGGSVGSGIQAYQDIRIRNAQLDNLKANNTILLEEAMNKVASRNMMIANTARTMTDTERIKFDLQMRNELAPYQMEAARLNNRRTEAQTYYTMNEDERRTAMNHVSIRAGLEAILTSRMNRAKTATEIQAIKAQIENVKRDGTLKDLEINLKKLGFTWDDPAWQRRGIQLFNQLLENFGINPGAGTGQGERLYDEWLDQYEKTKK